MLAGKYRVERVLGAGAMGVVVAAMHLDLGERVALKFLRPEAAVVPEVVARFAAEARAAARIKSEYVARVTDVGRLESGAPYMVMEYLEGWDLAAILAARGPLPCRDAVEHVLQACAAVAEAHALGIIHRDLKPANLFLANRPGGTPIVKVLDFGISKIVARGGAGGGFDPSVTRTTAWLGSPLYMSPEQMTSAKHVDARTDVWSLGAILFELLAGRPPFNAQSLPELFATILNSPPPSLDRPDAPPGLGDVIKKALTRELEHRFAGVAELAMALAPFAPTRARSAAERAVAVSEAAGLTVSSPARRPLDSTIGEEPRTSPASHVSSYPAAPLAAGVATAPSVPPPRFASAPPPPSNRPSAAPPAIPSTEPPPPMLVEPRSSGRGALILVMAGFLVLALGVGAYLGLRARDQREAAAAAAAAALASAAAQPVAAGLPPPTASATAPIAPSPSSHVLPQVDAGADAGAHVPPGKAHGSAPAPSSIPEKSLPAKLIPGGLDEEHCFANMPDGTRKPVPCP